VADNGKRSIDERIDALTMNLELLSHSVEAHDRQIDKLTDALAKLVAVTNEDATAIRTLARIADAHERRIADLEGGRA
jgi:ABC-type transporter Mla subunit MlaD